MRALIMFAALSVFKSDLILDRHAESGKQQPLLVCIWRLPRPMRAAVQVLIVFAALSTCDPGNVLDAVKAAKQHHVRVSVVGIAAEVHICRVLTQAR